MSPGLRLAWGLVALVVVLMVGSAGYVLIEGVSLFDSFYMVMITITTVGYEEAFPLSDPGKLWTLVILVSGFGVALYTAVRSVEHLLDLGEVRRRRQMQKRVSQLSEHVIVCGWGRVGRGTWSELRNKGIDVVVVESHPERAESARSTGALLVQGDATHNDVLELAGIESAQSLIACVADDSDNLVIALSAKGLRPELRVVCRAIEAESEQKLRLAGADAVVAPQAVGAERLALMSIKPELAQIFDVVVDGSPVEFHVEELDIAAGCQVAGKTIRDSNIRQDSGALVLAVEGGKEEIRVNPGPEVRLDPGDRLVVVGTKDQVRRAASMLDSG